jgi:hypothetical protein
MTSGGSVAARTTACTSASSGLAAGRPRGVFSFCASMMLSTCATRSSVTGCDSM